MQSTGSTISIGGTCEVLLVTVVVVAGLFFFLVLWFSRGAREAAQTQEHTSANMGSLFSKKKQPTKISQHDKAVLDLKVQRDKLQQYSKKVGTTTPHFHNEHVHFIP